MNRFQLTMLTALVPMVWGTTYVVTTEFLPPGYPIFAALMRALPAGILALALTRKLPQGTWWWKATLLGLLNFGAFFPLLFVTAYYLPGGVAATLGAVQPLMVMVLAIVLLKVPLSRWRLGWGIVGVVGVAFVVLRSGAALNWMGISAGLLGAVAMSVGITLTNKWGRPTGVSPMAFAGWQLTAGGLFLLPLTLVTEGIPPQIDGGAWLGYAWLGLVGGLLGYTIWFTGVVRLPVVSVTVLGLLSPLVAATLGIVLKDEHLGPLQLLGFILALASIVAGQRLPRRGDQSKSQVVFPKASR